jgi:uncharacterized protein YdhG (YjbR/CyaY superfamily)
MELVEEDYFSCGVPAYQWCGKPLTYDAAFQKQIGFYASHSGHWPSALRYEFSLYKRGKESVQFPIHEPMPVDLSRRVAQFRKKVNENHQSKEHKSTKT